MNSCESVIVSVDITNNSKSDGEEVVQLYIKGLKEDKANKTLKGFKRVKVNAGQTKNVEFAITPDMLSRWVDNEGFKTKKGVYSIMVGASSASKDLLKINLTIK